MDNPWGHKLTLSIYVEGHLPEHIALVASRAARRELSTYAVVKRVDSSVEPIYDQGGGDADDAGRSTATIAPVTVGASGDPGAPTETSALFTRLRSLANRIEAGERVGEKDAALLRETAVLLRAMTAPQQEPIHDLESRSGCPQGQQSPGTTQEEKSAPAASQTSATGPGERQTVRSTTPAASGHSANAASANRDELDPPQQEEGVDACEHGVAFDCQDCRREVLYLDPPQQEGADEKPVKRTPPPGGWPDLYACQKGSALYVEPCADCPGCPRQPQQSASPQPEAPVEAGEKSEYEFARCHGSKEIYVGGTPYGSPGDSYAPCFGCPDCLREEDAWICDSCGKWSQIDAEGWYASPRDDAGVTVEFCPRCKPASPESPAPTDTPSPDDAPSVPDQSEYETAGGDTIREGSGQSPDTGEEWPDEVRLVEVKDFGVVRNFALKFMHQLEPIKPYRIYVPKSRLEQVEAERDAQKRAELADYKRAEEVVEMWVARYQEADRQLAEIKERLEEHIEACRELRNLAEGDDDTEGVLIHGAALSALGNLKAAPSSTQHDDNQGGE